MISFPSLDFRQVAGLSVLGLLTLCIWRLYLHPLSDVPGPFAARLTRLWLIFRILKGDQNLTLVRMHDKYGEYGNFLLKRKPTNLWSTIRTLPSGRSQRGERQPS